MKKIAIAALAAVSVSAFLPVTAHAGGDPYHHGYAEKYIIKYDTIVSFEPRPRAETPVLLREGGYVQADCKGLPESDYGWCELHSPVFRAFVPRHCLKSAHGYYSGGPRKHHHYYNGHHEKHGHYGPDHHNGPYKDHHNGHRY